MELFKRKKEVWALIIISILIVASILVRWGLELREYHHIQTPMGW